MVVLKIIDALFLVGLVTALYWVWKHYKEAQSNGAFEQCDAEGGIARD